MVTNPTFLRVSDPTNGNGQVTQIPPVALDHTVVQWLRGRTPGQLSTEPKPDLSPIYPCCSISILRWGYQPRPL